MQAPPGYMHINPSEMSAGQRRAEISALLAAGFVRLRRSRVVAEALSESESKITQETATERLDLSRKTVLSVNSG